MHSIMLGEGQEKENNKSFTKKRIRQLKYPNLSAHERTKVESTMSSYRKIKLELCEKLGESKNVM